ncbi:MAG: hypothetical protein LBD61_02270 [Endomicrobium sp.]|jgi:hypothetical protein|nr:hypothetical protein [Endomicrobium sp.]
MNIMKKNILFILLFALSFVCSCIKPSATRTGTSRDPFMFVSGDKISVVHYDSYKVLVIFADIRTAKTKKVVLYKYQIDMNSLVSIENFQDIDGSLVGYINKKPLYAALLCITGNDPYKIATVIVFSYAAHVRGSIIYDYFINKIFRIEIFDEFYFLLNDNGLFYAIDNNDKRNIAYTEIPFK